MYQVARSVVLRQQSLQLLSRVCALNKADSYQKAAVNVLLRNRPFSESAEPSTGSSWVPQWLKSKLPGFAGGTETDELEKLDLDMYAKSLARARKLGALTGYVHGTSSIKDPQVQGGLRLQENIIGAMLPEEKQDLSSFGPAERERTAKQVGCTVGQVDDCIAKYLWMKQMTSKMAALKAAGQPLPTSIEEVEQKLGTWQDFKARREVESEFERAAPGGTIMVVADAKEPKSKQPCPLANTYVSRNTKCPLTSRRYKACCGKP
ncbi:g9643 [Coccomyxa elongata]